MKKIKLESGGKAETSVGLRLKNYNLYIGDEIWPSFGIFKYFPISRNSEPEIRIYKFNGSNKEDYIIQGGTYSVKLDWIEMLQIRSVLDTKFNINNI